MNELAGIATSFASGCRSSWFWILCNNRSVAQSEFGVRIDRGASAMRGRSWAVSPELLLWCTDWPPYSPDLNPIENAWHAMKCLVLKIFPDIIYSGGKSEEDIQKVEECLKAA